MAAKENLKCPGCGQKLSVSKHYDAVYEWFECPKCEGAYTYDEILETGLQKIKKAHGDKRRTEIVEEEEAPVVVAKKKKPSKKVEPEPDPEPVVYYRGEVATGEIVNIMADELQVIYTEMGLPQLDYPNAQEKALHIVRVLRTNSKIKFTEQEVKHETCARHG